MIYQVTSYTAATGYSKIGVTYVSGVGSLTSTGQYSFTFSRTGDKGSSVLLDRTVHYNSSNATLSVSSTAVPTGTKYVRVIAVAGGGQGGGVPTTTGTQTAAGSGGGGGGYIDVWYTAANFGSTYTASVGKGGSTGGANASGQAGTDTTVTGSASAGVPLITASAGGGGTVDTAATAPAIGATGGGAGGTSSATGTTYNIIQIKGGDGSRGGSVWANAE